MGCNEPTESRWKCEADLCSLADMHYGGRWSTNKSEPFLLKSACCSCNCETYELLTSLLSRAVQNLYYFHSELGERPPGVIGWNFFTHRGSLAEIRLKISVLSHHKNTKHWQEWVSSVQDKCKKLLPESFLHLGIWSQSYLLAYIISQIALIPGHIQWTHRYTLSRVCAQVGYILRSMCWISAVK